MYVCMYVEVLRSNMKYMSYFFSQVLLHSQCLLAAVIFLCPGESLCYVTDNFSDCSIIGNIILELPAVYDSETESTTSCQHTVNNTHLLL